MIILFFAAHLIVFSLISYLFAKKWNCLKSKLFWAGLIYHFVAAISLGLVYTFYYHDSDTFYYFNTAVQLSDYAKGNFFDTLIHLFDTDEVLHVGNVVVEGFRSIVFLKIVSLFALLCGNNYWVCAAYFSLLSFLSCWFLFSEVTTQFKNCHRAAAVAFLFFPSIVFWSSGVEKETLALASLYFLAVLFLRIYFRKKVSISFWFFFVIASAVLWLLKYYWAGVFFIVAIDVFLVQHLSTRFVKIKQHPILSYLFLLFIIGIGISFLHPNFYLHRFLHVLVSNHDALVAISKDASLIHFYHLKPSLSSIIVNSPLALFSGIFRPIIGEGEGLFGTLASVENFFIFALFLTALIHYKKNIRSQINLLGVAILSYCIVLCIFLALSTPNLGTLSRYRVGFLPFLIFVFSYHNSLLERLAKKLLK